MMKQINEQIFIYFYTKIKFDIIFFDPPYEAGIYELVLNQLATLEIFSTQSLIVVEHSTRTEIAIPENFDIIKQKKYGETAIAILTLAEN